MPVVDVAHRVGLGADDAWKAVADFEAFPRIAASIRNVEILDERGPIRDSRWTVFFEDSELEWQEEDVIDEKERRIDFRLVDGDLAHLDGYWQVVENGTGAVVEFRAEFDLGIPLMADLLDPVAERALRESVLDILVHLDPAAGRVS